MIKRSPKILTSEEKATKTTTTTTPAPPPPFWAKPNAGPAQAVV